MGVSSTVGWMSVLGVAAELEMSVHTPRVLGALAAARMGVIIF